MTRFYVPPCVAILLALSIAVCHSTEESKTTIQKDKLGSTQNVTRFGKTMFGGQPTRAAFEEAQQRGIEVLITFRQEGEVDWDEAQKADELGILFHRFGFRTPESLSDELIDRFSMEAVHRTMIQFDAVKPDAGEMPIVLAAGSSGILLHEAIGHGMEGDFNRKNESIYADKVGKRIAEPIVTIVDDGTNLNEFGSINLDDEAHESKRTVLVQNGILETYMHDRISASFYGVAPTGNGKTRLYAFTRLAGKDLDDPANRV